MTFPVPCNLTDALIGPLAKDLEARYPGWRVVGYNGSGLDVKHPSRWAGVPEAEREAWRVAELQKWRANGWCKGDAPEGSEDEKVILLCLEPTLR